MPPPHLHTCPICTCVRTSERIVLLTCRDAETSAITCQTHFMCSECWVRMENRPCPTCRARTGNPRRLSEVLPPASHEEVRSTAQSMRAVATRRRIARWVTERWRRRRGGVRYGSGLSESGTSLYDLMREWEAQAPSSPDSSRPASPDAPPSLSPSSVTTPHPSRDDDGESTPPPERSSSSPTPTPFAAAGQPPRPFSRAPSRSVQRPTSQVPSEPNRRHMEFVTAELAALSRRMRWHTQIVRLAESGEALGTARRFAQELVRYHTPEAVRHRGGLDIVASITGMPMNVGAELADLVDRHAAAASPTSPERERTISQALLTAVRRSAASQLPEIVSRLLQNYI